MWKSSFLVAALLVAPGCSDPAEHIRVDPSPSGDLGFSYFGIAEPGMIDQTLTITNSSSDAVVPTLSFTAVDGAGDPLEGVHVGTVFGSDRGLVVIPAGFEAFDILTFHGHGVERVEDVEVAVEGSRDLRDEGMAYPKLEYLDSSGKPAAMPSLAETVRIENAGSQEILVRLVRIQWNSPRPGQSQQAREVSPVGHPVVVGAHDTTVVPIPETMRGRLDSLKGYISTD